MWISWFAYPRNLGSHDMLRLGDGVVVGWVKLVDFWWLWLVALMHLNGKIKDQEVGDMFIPEIGHNVLDSKTNCVQELLSKI